MSLFQYIGFLEDGKKTSGLIDAGNVNDARILLDKKKIILLEIKEPSKKEINLSKKELLCFTEELSKLNKAGLALYEALLALSEKYEKSRIEILILGICDKIKSGQSRSKAFSSYPKTFDIIYCSMIENAEKTGKLPEALDEISIILSKQSKLKKQMVATLTYPAILAIFCFVVLCSLFFFVIPSLFELFEGKSVHPLTKAVLAISKALCSIKFILLGLFILLIIMVVIFLLNRDLKKKAFGFLITLPLMKDLFIKIALIRFSRSFSTLLLGGESYLNAISLSAKVMNHPLLEKEIIGISERIKEGEALSKLFKESQYIPPLVPRMLAIAEEGGKMAEMLKHISEIYEDEIEKILAQITAILQPVILLILGVIVGFVVLSVLLPLTDVSSFIGGEEI